MPIDACYEDNKISINDVNKVITKIKKIGGIKRRSSTSNLLEEFEGLMENIKKAYMLKNEDISIIKNDLEKLLEEYCNKTPKVYRRWTPRSCSEKYTNKIVNIISKLLI